MSRVVMMTSERRQFWYSWTRTNFRHSRAHVIFWHGRTVFR
jgi:hypothetical protein